MKRRTAGTLLVRFDRTAAKVLNTAGRSNPPAFRAAAPVLVLLDLALPKVPGREVCRQIREESPNLPIIILSAAAEELDKVLLLELGADDYVTKPFSPKELLARVRAVLRRTQPASKVGMLRTARV